MPHVSPLKWRKSSRSGGGNACVEIAILDRSHVAIRDSKDPDGGLLVVSRAGMTAWLSAIKDNSLS